VEEDLVTGGNLLRILEGRGIEKKLEAFGRPARPGGARSRGARRRQFGTGMAFG
jgi:hypothetical protein